MVYVSHRPEDTRSFAREQALKLTQENKSQPLVIALEGELGAGKTTFIQAFAEGLGVQEPLKSPTFVLMKKYELNPPAGGLEPYSFLYHFDCYRLKDEQDLISLGIQNILNEKEAIILIEWAERVQPILPIPRITIHIDHVGENERKITYEKISTH